MIGFLAVLKIAAMIVAGNVAWAWVAPHIPLPASQPQRVVVVGTEVPAAQHEVASNAHP